MSVLILGKGYIGTLLSQELDCQIKSQKELEYTISEKLTDYLHNNNITWVVNCFGFTGNPNVDQCEQNMDYKIKTWDYNVRVPLMLATVCKQLSINFINISSGCVYNGYEKHFTEEDPSNFGIWNTESSYYSKSKHACELNLANFDCYQLRIRIPFCSRDNRKNYLSKLYNFTQVIPENNSITNVYDLSQFIKRLIDKKPEFGIYNVVNEGIISGVEVKSMLKFQQIEIVSESYLNLHCKRSNCILSTEKINQLGLQLPPVRESLKRDIEYFLINRS